MQYPNRILLLLPVPVCHWNFAWPTNIVSPLAYRLSYFLKEGNAQLHRLRNPLIANSTLMFHFFLLCFCSAVKSVTSQFFAHNLRSSYIHLFTICMCWNIKANSRLVQKNRKKNKNMSQFARTQHPVAMRAIYRRRVLEGHHSSVRNWTSLLRSWITIFYVKVSDAEKEYK